MFIPDRDKKGLTHVQFPNKTSFSEKGPLYMTQTRSYEETYNTLDTILVKALQWPHDLWHRQRVDAKLIPAHNFWTICGCDTTRGVVEAGVARLADKYTMYYFLYLTKPNALSDHNVCLSHTGSQALSLWVLYTQTHTLSHTHAHRCARSLSCSIGIDSIPAQLPLALSVNFGESSLHFFGLFFKKYVFIFIFDRANAEHTRVPTLI